MAEYRPRCGSARSHSVDSNRYIKFAEPRHEPEIAIARFYIDTTLSDPAYGCRSSPCCSILQTTVWRTVVTERTSNLRR